jgi:hypothetical protein
MTRVRAPVRTSLRMASKQGLEGHRLETAGGSLPVGQEPELGEGEDGNLARGEPRSLGIVQEALTSFVDGTSKSGRQVPSEHLHTSCVSVPGMLRSRLTMPLTTQQRGHSGWMRSRGSKVCARDAALIANSSASSSSASRASSCSRSCPSLPILDVSMSPKCRASSISAPLASMTISHVIAAPNLTAGGLLDRLAW